MPDLHPGALGFGAAAEAYERGRPDYPAAAVNRLVERLGLRPGRMVLDLAAGTGKLTRALVPTGANIVAVEPIPEMRAQLEKRVPGVAAMTGTAERIPLGDCFVDAVVVASAFHWFRSDEALREIHRVLKPGGGLALIWNTRDQRDPLQAAITALLEPLQGDTPRRRERDWRRLVDESGLFGPCETSLFRHRQALDEDGLVERVLSISFVAAAPRSRRAEIEEQARALSRARGGHAVLPYLTELYLAFRPLS
ncbi:MAG TPA: class I SAM-dependent methyltransferase [Gaiellaceae bacterium]